MVSENCHLGKQLFFICIHPPGKIVVLGDVFLRKVLGEVFAPLEMVPKEGCNEVVDAFGLLGVVNHKMSLVYK